MSVVVPCFDEEASADRYQTELVLPLDALRRPYELLFVDDGSTDGTFRRLADLADRLPTVRVVRHAVNRGLGAALRTGFAAAKGAWIATLDADLTFPPASLGALIERQRATGADLVSGSPWLEPGASAGVSWRRRLPSRLVNGVYRAVVGPRLTSYTGLMRLYRADALRRVAPQASGFEINAELAAAFIRAGLTVAEVSVPLGTRRGGRSKLVESRELARHGRLLARLLTGF